MGARAVLVRRKRRGAHHAGIAYSRQRVIDTNGAGDVFHGAYVYSCLATRQMDDHSSRARGPRPQDTSVSAMSRLASVTDIEAVNKESPIIA